jgi:hypothetical protein
VGSIRSTAIYLALMERFGWTVEEIDEMPDDTLKWLLSMMATAEPE